MKRIFILLFLSIITFHSFGQIDSVHLQNFLAKQEHEEQQFINFLKQGKIDSCLVFFSSSVINNYTRDSLKFELQKIINLYSMYPNQKNEVSYGKPFEGVGAFGHNCNGSIEKKSEYVFYDSTNVSKYWFELYYTNVGNFGEIIFFEKLSRHNYNQVKLKHARKAKSIFEDEAPVYIRNTEE